ncbi:MAG: bifunctional alpha,alpha-trehalose-phosphate synthase (UDP-forming)/trehalose-phosphatase [Vicinamibacterales bacterium]
MTSGRLLIVSNRLPVTAQRHGDGVRVVASSGGLATGLGPWHAGSQGLWIGWPGDVSSYSAEQLAGLSQMLEERAIVPVYLSGDQVKRHYHGFANRVLWPLLHYLIDRVPVDATGWEAYRQVNEAFADVVAYHYRSGDLIWVHDYQLMLLPAMLRERLPKATIGFFLHVPFPSSEVFRILPWRRQILHGLLGADLIGFHTFAYLRHFLASLLHVDGVEADVFRVRLGAREARLGVFPMGIDAGRFDGLARSERVAANVEQIRQDVGERHLVLGVDRLDYTKGIPRRLQAIERVLEQDSHLRDDLRYLQVAVPSRGDVDAYRRFRPQVEEAVGRINGRFGTPRSAPVHYLHQSVAPEQLSALYRAADVMLVTPLRDGMNLVAKEFVASRVDGEGVLILSEFAGAAAELDGALVVNPYDVEGVAEAIRRALTMPDAERRSRMAKMRQRVASHDVHAWAGAFMEAMGQVRPAVLPRPAAAPGPSLSTALEAARRAPSLRLLLDSDGTLVPFARSPGRAAPAAELVDLLRDLGGRPGTDIEIVSGRPRDTLESWLGALPVSLWAEHGFWWRPVGSGQWQPTSDLDPAWLERLVPIFTQFAEATPGAFVERKSASIAWHYRRAHREFGPRQAHELRMLLGDALSNQPFEVLEGKKVIEVRLRGVSKAVVGRHVSSVVTPDTAVLAFGDDRTDDDLFRALPASVVTVAVGTPSEHARFSVRSPAAVRTALRSFVTDDDRATPAA